MSVNFFSPAPGGNLNFAGAGALVMERNQMLIGNSARIIGFQFTSSNIEWSLLPSDADGNILPPVGAPNYFFFPVDGNVSGGTDRIIYREFNTNWSNPTASTLSAQKSINVVAFSEILCNYSRNCIPQPETARKLDPLSTRFMHRAQYRNFGSYQTIVSCHTVNVGSNRAGIRWYELRNTGSGWTIYQQGTYSPGTEHRWMGSIAMDGNGNIALGYSVSSSTMFPSIKYTGRTFSDPLGTLSLAEQTIINGTGSQTGTASRWGDYSMMSIDPVDDATFWYTNEYLATTGTAPWRTRIASLSLASLSLDTPNGSEIWSFNTNQNINWTAQGIKNIKAEYSTDNGTTWDLLNNSIDGTIGSFQWSIPDIPTEKALVRISDAINPFITRQSLNTFFMPTASFTTNVAAGNNSTTTFTGTGFTLKGDITNGGTTTVSYYRDKNKDGILPSGVESLSKYYWILEGNISASNGLISTPTNFLTGVVNPNELVWLQNSTPGGNFLSFGGTINGPNLESTVPLNIFNTESFTRFSIGSTSQSNPLPVELHKFTAVSEGKNIVLKWETAGEVNSYCFSIERNYNSDSWQILGEVKAAGNSNSARSYSFQDLGLGNGLYKYRLKMIDNDGSYTYSKTIEEEIKAPANIELSQNFPNPFNPETKIRFSIPVESFVKLTIYNMVGEKLAVLADEVLDAGFYERNFIGDNLPSGTYFYSIETKSITNNIIFNQTRKMLLLK